MTLNLIKLRRSMVSWMVALMVLGYPISASIVTVLGVESTVINYPFRFMMVAFSLMLITTGFLKPLPGRLDRWVMLFFGIYMVRLGHDWIIQDLPVVTEAIKFFLLIVLIPCLAVWIAVDHAFDHRALCRRLIILGTIFLILFYFNLLTGRLDMSASEIEMSLLYQIGQRQSLEALNPIAFGHANLSIFICALIYLQYCRMGAQKFAMIAMICVTLPLIFQSGSRAPVLALAAVLAWYVGGRASRLLYLLPAAGLGVFLVPADSYGLYRVLELLEGVNALDSSALIRLRIQADALDAFQKNPVFGKHFLDPYWGEGRYPHNIFIETAMALGMIGLTILFVIIMRILRASSAFGRTHSLLVLLLIQYAIAAQFSGALYGNSTLFVLGGLILAISHNVRNQRLMMVPEAELPAASRPTFRDDTA